MRRPVREACRRRLSHARPWCADSIRARPGARPACQRQRRQLNQQQHVVIGRRAVHPQPPAVRAAVNQHPLVLAADGDRDRLHGARAASLPVTGDVAIKVPGPQAAGAVVAMRRAGSVQRDIYAAMSALKRARKRQVWLPFRVGLGNWADISPPLVLTKDASRPGRRGDLHRRRLRAVGQANFLGPEASHSNRLSGPGCRP